MIIKITRINELNTQSKHYDIQAHGPSKIKKKEI